MAGLRLGIPVVTNRGRLTEPLWDETHAVKLTDIQDAPVFGQQLRRLLQRPEERRDLAQTGRDLYDRVFALRHTIAALRQARV
jgi:hypothetical protein